MKNHSRLLGLVGFVIFIYLMLNIDLTTLIDSFKKMNLYFFTISLFFVIPGVSIKALKWLLLIRKEDRISFGRAIVAWIVGFSYGLITPVKLGDFLRAKFLKTKPGKSILTVFIDRVNDIVVLLFLGVFSFFILFSKNTFLFNLGYLFAFLLIISVVGVFILRNEKLIKKIGKPFYKYLVPKKFKKIVGENFNVFYRNFEKLNKKIVLINFLLTILAWFIAFVQYWFLSIALGMTLDLFHICLISPILLLVQLIPVTISGIGTREAASILLLSTFAVSPELAIAFSLGILFEDYILASFGYLALLKIR
jgi:hypothetical protein